MTVFSAIKAHPGIRRKDLVAMIDKSDATVGRLLRSLTERDLVEHRGSKKLGGYYVRYE